MLGYVSKDFYGKSYVGKWLFEVMGREWDGAQRILADELPKQLFPETATWGLKYHEEKWQLPVRENLPYEERRRLIYQKRDVHVPMTPYHMEKCLERVTGLEVHVSDMHDPGRFGETFGHPNEFHVTVIGDSSLDLRDVRAVVDRLKQSHTVYTVEALEGRFEAACCTYMAVVPQTKKSFEVEVL